MTTPQPKFTAAEWKAVVAVVALAQVTWAGTGKHAQVMDLANAYHKIREMAP